MKAALHEGIAATTGSEVASAGVELQGTERRVSVRMRRRLPHWTADGGTYFVTFRLFDSLSPELARRIAGRKLAHRLVDRFLDRGDGCCYLRDPRAADIVQEAVRFFHGQRYVLHAWAVMPNHVHAVFRTMPGVTLASVTHSWKSFTAGQINRLLLRSGRLWREESFDTLIRDSKQFERIVAYVFRNPEKAGLMNWRWASVLDTPFELRPPAV